MKEGSVFLGAGATAQTISGEEAKFPCLTWGQELKIIKLVGELGENIDLEKAFSALTEGGKGEDYGPAIQALLEIFKKTPDVLTEIVKIITGWSEEEVCSKFELDQMLELVTVPFVKFSKVWQKRAPKRLQKASEIRSRK